MIAKLIIISHLLKIRLIWQATWHDCFFLFIKLDIPMSGTASDVVGIDSATKFKNTVNDRRIVTPAI